MSDIFREVDEDVQRDRLAEFWEKYSIAVYGLAVAVVVGTAIFAYLRHQKQTEAEAAGALYEAAETLASQKKPEAAARAFDELARTAPQGYRILSRLRAAGETGLTDRAAGVKAFDLIAAEPGLDPLLVDLARLRAGLLRVDEADKTELEQRFTALLNGPFRHSAREFLGLAALKRGDYESAGKYFDQLVVDPNAPANLRQRVQALLSVVRGGGKFAAPAAAEPAQK
ncbi:tetratricopeptide repeat protein [uncultured Rhodoblastus sp.]|uniref:tetratricopeptide repeat protein n=1 Tax=uncultured Rhodoblastus sp. TaxID=543037 RepID=UPI0025D766C9|nr:tetratricopeptide repeat protein [uncultured Rhodoblastus sp.]